MILQLLHSLAALFRSRADLTLENLAIRQQLAILKERKPRPEQLLVEPSDQGSLTESSGSCRVNL